MRSLFLTGASGLLGGHLYAQAQERWSVTAISHSHPLTGTIPLDLTDRPAVLAVVRARRPDVILHAAANANLDLCQIDPSAAAAINVEAVAMLLEAAHECSARLILVSSDMVFDGSTGLYREADPVHPLSVYGETKVAAENLVLAAGPPHLAVRAALIYGRPRRRGSSFSQWIEARLQAGEKVPLYTDQFRSPVWVENLAAVLLELAGIEVSGLLHCGGANRIDRYTFAHQLCRAAGYDTSLLLPTSMQDTTSPAPRPADVSLDSQRAAALLKTPLLATEEGLRRMAAQ